VNELALDPVACVLSNFAAVTTIAVFGCWVVQSRLWFCFFKIVPDADSPLKLFKMGIV
jgi:hypothetical protein